MTRRHWMIIVALAASACLLAGGLSALYLVNNVPAAARLVRRDASPPLSQYTPAPTSESPQSGWIAFETDRGELGDYEIYAMAPDGSRLTNLTQSWADDLAPVWSPDGQRIAFVSLRDTLAGKWGMGPRSIYVMEFDPQTGAAGTNVARLTGEDMDAGWPTWSPNGARVAFGSDRGGNPDVWVVNLDGTGLANLTEHPADDQFPAWSPDGSKIAFTSNRGGNLDVWVMDADGSDPVNLTNTPGPDRYAMWSPDGQRIAFNTRRDGDQEVYAMGANGEDQTNLTQAPDSIEGLADWSPDGRRLVLYSDRPGNKDVFILDLATGDWTNVTNHPASDEFSTWSP
jgi:Tol biopolymer transport system component